MRLFIAIDLPDAIKKILKSIRDKISYEGIKCVDDFHITLKFLGEIDDHHADRIMQALSLVTFNQFKISLDETGFFPDEKHMRVVWLGVNPPIQVIELHHMITRALNYEFPERNTFHPHITLARMRAVSDKKQFLETINSIEIPKKTVSVKHFALFKSKLTLKGPVYELLESYDCVGQGSNMSP